MNDNTKSGLQRSNFRGSRGFAVKGAGFGGGSGAKGATLTPKSGYLPRKFPKSQVGFQRLGVEGTCDGKIVTKAENMLAHLRNQCEPPDVRCSVGNFDAGPLTDSLFFYP